MNSGFSFPSVTATTFFRRVCRPFSDLNEGLRSISLDLQTSLVRACKLRTLTPRAAALVGILPSRDNPGSWVSSPLHGEPQFVYTPTSLDLFMAPKTVTIPARASNGRFEGVNSDNRWVPPVEDIGNGLKALPYIMAGSYDGRCVPPRTTFLLRSVGSDRRWVPPWLVTHVKSLLKWPISMPLIGLMLPGYLSSVYALDVMFLVSKFLLFLQGFLSQELSKFYELLKCGSTILHCLHYATCDNIFLVRNSFWNCFDARFHNLNSEFEVKVSNPPPTPNIPKKDSSFLIGSTIETIETAHAMSKPMLLWFEASGFQPPWPDLGKSKLLVGCASCPALFTLRVETVARKHYRVVVNGTSAQVHTFYALVASYPRWKAFCCLSTGLGSHNIRRRGWELDSVDVKRQKIWKASTIAVFIWNQCNVGSNPRHELSQLCKTLL